MYYFKLMHCGLVVTTRALQAQGSGFQSGPGSTHFPPLVVFHYSTDAWVAQPRFLSEMTTEK